MKKRLILLIVLILSFPFIAWMAKASTHINIAILDKTVYDSSYREHKGFVWLLNHLKYVKKDTNKTYNYKEDYYGWHLNATQSIKELPELNNTDLIYVADTYGVYQQEQSGENISGSRSALIYGGMRSDELEKIRKATYSGATLVCEFNAFASPTDQQTQQQMYDLLGVSWSGWIGRYFEDMTSKTEVPDWLVQNYESQYNEKWGFSGKGLVFVNAQDEVIVLEDKEIAKMPVQFKFTKEGEAFFNKKGSYTYNYWFDIVQPYAATNVLAEYTLNISDEGKKKIQQKNIPPSFPAIADSNTGLYQSYYFAGDYADYEGLPSISAVAGLTDIMERLPLSKQDAFYWKCYIPVMKTLLKLSSTSQLKAAEHNDTFFTDNTTKMVSKTNQEDLQIFNNGKWQDFVVKGVNMGMAVPGKWFTEFPKQESIYLDWFKKIAEMKANTIRVYTLMDPSFYRALLKYNTKNKDNPLWLLQEIWPEENPEDNDYLKNSYTEAFDQEIKYVVDAVHGNATISQRTGRAYGDYYADVSRYILGILVGRELEPQEVIATNEKNTVTTFKGDYVSVNKGSATEVWLAKSCDSLLGYEQSSYGWQHPVAIVSWPTLDVIEHEGAAVANENGQPDYNDKVSIDIRHLLAGEKMRAGLFGAYHIYPNYPDFMNNTPAYAEYKDSQGVFNYGGYLKQFMQYHKGYPAVVAEFGLATGMGNAHANPDGYNHGGLTEQAQGEGIVRMMQAIQKEGYAGGVVFEWMDEWAKKTWITEPFIKPFEHNVFWHNAIDPEQNYGILAMESTKPEVAQYSITGEHTIKQVQMSADETYLYIDVRTQTPLDLTKDKLLIGLDTYDENKGSYSYNKDIAVKAPTGMEFLVELGNNQANLLVIPQYNIAKYHFASVENAQGEFETINPIINNAQVTRQGNQVAEVRQDGSKLNNGFFKDSYNHWYQQGDSICLRLPWGRLNISDPTTYQVLDDSKEYFAYPNRDEIKTTTTQGIGMSMLLVEGKSNVIDQIPNASENKKQRFLWPTWTQPKYTERLKESYYILKDYFSQLQ